MSGHLNDNLPPLEPRLGDGGLKHPHNPFAYFFVGFFLGFVPMCFLAVSNAGRLTRNPKLRQTTLAISIVISVAGFGLLALGPSTWVDTRSSARLLIQVVGAVGSLALNAYHRGPALSRLLGSDGYETAWKRIVPLFLIALLQAAVATAVLSARGLQ